MNDSVYSPTGHRLLVLVPTAFELAGVPENSLRRWTDVGAAVELCGLGPVAAAARTSQLVAALQPKLVVLLGIAGAYEADADGDDEGQNESNPHLVIGRAYEFSAVACHGMGVGEGNRHRGAAELGWDERFQLPEARGVIELGSRAAGGSGTPEGGRLLLSVFAASADRREAAARRHRHPQALAEDMEAYAVAVSCRMAGVPLRVVRGISNVAADRDHRHWRVADALASAAEKVSGLFLT